MPCVLYRAEASDHDDPSFHIFPALHHSDCMFGMSTGGAAFEQLDQGLGVGNRGWARVVHQGFPITSGLLLRTQSENCEARQWMAPPQASKQDQDSIEGRICPLQVRGFVQEDVPEFT